MSDYLLLLAGVASAAIGGEFFVRGAVGIASVLRIAPSIIGVTIAAFATSSPELSVAVNSGLAGKSQLSLGDALGSNIVNISLVLGITLLIAGIPVGSDVLKRDMPVAVLAPLLTGILLIDGIIDRLEGLFMFAIFVAWMATTVKQALKERAPSNSKVAVTKRFLPWVHVFAGLLLLVAAGRLIVLSTTGIAKDFGIDDFIIGATLVAFGTSVPELASTVLAKIKGHDEIGVGTVVGSNIFNSLFIVAVAAIIRPIRVPLTEVVPAILFGILSLLIALPRRGTGWVRRRQGVLLVLMYSIYVTTLFFFSR
ncbi:sodium:calcium antiporter [Chlorobaculum limnaeum]|uniref:Sodium:calcium antiporter n=1 Tax=Chlorobaculum limnaeum TaxID=274537 RepID=A0A1D8D3Y8_CHLLM|nr:sodium:calcium antiporter [Chlorobaculum limnaeum]AOS83797.1 sodium:calcium antiporter [Chlorobaculum limnaeum]